MTERRLTLVTGAAGGIGRAVVARFVEGGDRVVAHDRDADGVRELAAGFEPERVVPVSSTLPDLDALRAALTPVTDRHGPLGAVVANAGSTSGVALSGLGLDGWRADLDANLTAGYVTVEAALDGLRATRGNVVFVGSVNGLTALGDPAYSAAKAGLISYARAIAMEYGPAGVRANVVCPGTVRTPIWQQRVERNPQVFEDLRKWYPLGDVVQPEDVAEAIWFLASPQARMISGAMLPVDGGLMAGNRQMATDLTSHPF